MTHPGNSSTIRIKELRGLASLIELAMIVRNGGTALARAMESARPAVDRIVIGDTGSTDGSVELARSLGADVFDVPWQDDFSLARNTVLAACRGDWVLILDADEMLDPAGAAILRTLTAKSDIDAWEVWRWNYIRTRSSRSGVESSRPNPYLLEESRPYPAYTRHPNTLLFRRRPDLYFEYAVHETVARRVHALKLRTAEAPFVIHHFGNAEDSEEKRQEKLERYHQMGIRKVELHPRDDWAHYELGLSELEYRRDPREALLCFETALKLQPDFAPAWLYAGICLTRLGRPREALTCLAHAEARSRPNALLREAAGDAFFHSDEIAQAAGQYRLAGGDAELSPLAACKLGACEVRLGQSAQGLARIQSAVESEPGAAELYDIWTAAAMLAGEIETAANVAERRLRIAPASAVSSPDRFVVAAGLQARLGQWQRAASILREAIRQYPEDVRLQKEWKIATDRAESRPAKELDKTETGRGWRPQSP
ncbi:glycosyltransferase [Silvibacterium sp.]|uniref:glycosyltransferase n=1 Tax=Silvibacterium sp. TaxID=1964179 RepID=UPI0039E544DC